MQHPSIYFTDIEAEAIEHRLSFLAAIDEDDCAELFGADTAVDAVTEYAGRIAQQIKEGGRIIPLDAPVAGAVLLDAVDGATFLEAAKEAEDDGSISKQKLNAYQAALSRVEAKIRAHVIDAAQDEQDAEDWNRSMDAMRRAEENFGY